MDQRTKLADLQQQLTTLSNKPDITSVGSTSLSKKDQIKADIDELVASECLYCGELMIEWVILEVNHIDYYTSILIELCKQIGNRKIFNLYSATLIVNRLRNIEH